MSKINWSQESVEKVALKMVNASLSAKGLPTVASLAGFMRPDIDAYRNEAKAALAIVPELPEVKAHLALTLHDRDVAEKNHARIAADNMRLREEIERLKRVVEAANRVFQCDGFRYLPQSIQLALSEALAAPFTGGTDDK